MLEVPVVYQVSMEYEKGSEFHSRGSNGPLALLPFSSVLGRAQVPSQLQCGSQRRY
jgi:hypothetical protein